MANVLFLAAGKVAEFLKYPKVKPKPLIKIKKKLFCIEILIGL